MQKRNKIIKYYFIGRMFENIDLYDKPFWVFLYQSFQGIGKTSAKRISMLLGLSCEKSIKMLLVNPVQVILFLKLAENYIKNNNLLLGRSLLRYEQTNMEFEIKRGSYKGFRYLQQLPIRKQRTHTNANSVKRVLNIKLKNLRLVIKKT